MRPATSLLGASDVLKLPFRIYWSLLHLFRGYRRCRSCHCRRRRVRVCSSRRRCVVANSSIMYNLEQPNPEIKEDSQCCRSRPRNVEATLNVQ